ncbi:hypothetical protein ACF0H5_009983 [Mactra antiquata]
MNHFYVVVFVVLSVVCTTTAFTWSRMNCPKGCADSRCHIGTGCIRCIEGYCMSSTRFGGRLIPFCASQCPDGQECLHILPDMRVCTASRRTTTTRSWRRG